MGRPKQGWKLRWRTGRAYVRFTHAGEPFELATGECDPGAAARAAGEIYARHTVGGEQHKRRRGASSRIVETESAVAGWIADLTDTHDARTAQSYEQYAVHWCARWPLLSSMSARAIDTWARERLAEVQARTLRKQTSAMRGFLAWCVGHGLMAEAPPIPRLSRRTLGTVVRPLRRHPDLTDRQVERILAALPEVAARRGRNGALCPVRAYYRVAWETGLRGGTLVELEAPAHYRKGALDLVIPDAGDKARFGRTVPLTAKARAALDRVVPDIGRIFPRKPGRDYLRAAALATGLPAHVVEAFTPYSLRHARVVNLLEASGNLLGVGYLVGHKHASTTDKYLRARHRHAADVLAKATRVSGDSPETLPRKGKTR